MNANQTHSITLLRNTIYDIYNIQQLHCTTHTIKLLSETTIDANKTD
jgi:hypothetical protein